MCHTQEAATAQLMRIYGDTGDHHGPIEAELTRLDSPDLPITPNEIAEEAYRCRNEGARVVHLPARLADGQTSPPFN